MPAPCRARRATAMPAPCRAGSIELIADTAATLRSASVRPASRRTCSVAARSREPCVSLQTLPPQGRPPEERAHAPTPGGGATPAATARSRRRCGTPRTRCTSVTTSTRMRPAQRRVRTSATGRCPRTEPNSLGCGNSTRSTRGSTSTTCGRRPVSSSSSSRLRCSRHSSPRRPQQLQPRQYPSQLASREPQGTAPLPS
jgi:hypothetical protein